MPFNWAAVLNILFTTVFSESLACMLQIADYVKFTYIYIYMNFYIFEEIYNWLQCRKTYIFRSVWKYICNILVFSVNRTAGSSNA